MSIENKQPQLQPAESEHSVADDLLAMLEVQGDKARIDEGRTEVFRRFQAGEISRDDYNRIVQESDYGESAELRQQEVKSAALDRINSGSQTKLGHRVLSFLHHK